jgi:fumarate hydratase class I
MCQDTGTAIVMGKKGQQVWTSGGDEEAIARACIFAPTETQPALLAARAARHVRGGTPATTCRRRSSSTPTDGDEYRFLFMAKGGGSANKSFLYQETKALLNPKSLLAFVEEAAKPRHRGVPALPPRDRHRRHLGRVHAEEVAKLASARYLDTCRPRASKLGRAFRDLEPRGQKVQLSQRKNGIGAQFGGKYFCHDVRVIRLPRHGASCPIGIGVSCSADRQAKGKITKDGVFLEQLERTRRSTCPRSTTSELGGDVREDRPEPADGEIRATLSKYPIKTRCLADRADDRGARHRPRQDARAARVGRRACRST